MEGTFTCGTYSHVEGTFTCGTYSHVSCTATIIYMWWWGTFTCVCSHMCHVQQPYTVIYVCHIHSNLCVAVGDINVCEFSHVSHTATIDGNLHVSHTQQFMCGGGEIHVCDFSCVSHTANGVGN